jgi:hypothetical protein
MCLKKCGPAGEDKERDFLKAKLDNVVSFVCPYCHAVSKINKSEFQSITQICNSCGKRLTGNYSCTESSLKCFDCILSMETPDGIWCLKSKKMVNETMARNCGDFVNKKIVHSREGDNNERKNIQNLD